jgi:hypothetical protein
MPVVDYAPYCDVLDRARQGRFAHRLLAKDERLKLCFRD